METVYNQRRHSHSKEFYHNSAFFGSLKRRIEVGFIDKVKIFWTFLNSLDLNRYSDAVNLASSITFYKENQVHYIQLLQEKLKASYPTLESFLKDHGDNKWCDLDPMLKDIFEKLYLEKYQERPSYFDHCTMCCNLICALKSVEKSQEYYR